MKQEQRKYAVQRLSMIFEEKVAAIKAAFERTESARDDVVQPVIKHYPGISDVLRKLAGLESNVELADDYVSQLVNLPETHYVGHLGGFFQSISKPVNQAAVDARKQYELAKSVRETAAVTDKVALLVNHKNRSLDALYLGGQEEALAALAEFQAVEV